LSDILGHCFLDDIIITGVTDAEHLENLEKVLLKMSKHGLKLNNRKCVLFFEEVVEYCGHKINAEGLHKSQKHIQAILEPPHPINVTEVKAFCGFVQYCNKFLQNIAQVLYPLYTLTKKTRDGNGQRNVNKH
jgi:hypothetical protein